MDHIIETVKQCESNGNFNPYIGSNEWIRHLMDTYTRALISSKVHQDYDKGNCDAFGNPFINYWSDTKNCKAWYDKVDEYKVLSEVSCVHPAQNFPTKLDQISNTVTQTINNIGTYARMIFLPEDTTNLTPNVPDEDVIITERNGENHGEYDEDSSSHSTPVKKSEESISTSLDGNNVISSDISMYSHIVESEKNNDEDNDDKLIEEEDKKNR